jgi:hypothetical protein
MMMLQLVTEPAPAGDKTRAEDMTKAGDHLGQIIGVADLIQRAAEESGDYGIAEAARAIGTLAGQALDAVGRAR